MLFIISWICAILFLLVFISLCISEINQRLFPILNPQKSPSACKYVGFRIGSCLMSHFTILIAIVGILLTTIDILILKNTSNNYTIPLIINLLSLIVSIYAQYKFHKWISRNGI